MRRILLTLSILAVASSAHAEEYVVKAANVLTMAGKPLTPGAVRVKDGKIVEVAAKIDAPAGVKVIDLGDGTLMPGLIDAANTLAIDGGSAESTREVTPHFRVLDAVDWSSRDFRQARADGTTTVAILPGTENVIDGLSCIVKTAGDKSRRVVNPAHSLVMALASDPASGNGARNRPDSIYTRQPTNRMGVVWILRSEFAKARAKAPSSSAEMQSALDGKLPVVCVSRVDSDITAALRLKQDFSFPLTIAGGHEAYRMKSELAAAKVSVLLAPVNTASSTGPEGADIVLNPAGLLNEAGVTFALTGGKLLDQARWAVRHGLPADAALAAVTATPAKLLGVDSRVGTIAVGRDADLIALSGSPFDLKSTIRWTMIDGVLRAEEP